MRLVRLSIYEDFIGKAANNVNEDVSISWRNSAGALDDAEATHRCGFIGAGKLSAC